MWQSFAQVDASDTPLRSRNVSHIASDSGHLPQHLHPLRDGLDALTCRWLMKFLRCGSPCLSRLKREGWRI
jgi:hypothetical protein